MVLLAALVSLALGLAPDARAANGDLGGRQDSDIFALLEGRWTGSGTLLGRPTQFHMRWTRVLKQRFAQLEFENAFLPADTGPPTPVLSAIAIYPLAGPAPRSGHWFDSRGAMLALTITPSDSALHVAWQGAGERGRTVYRVASEGIVVVDSVAAAGGWREFGRATYARSTAAAQSGASARRFELRSDARVGLHHFLVTWGIADAGRWPPFAPPVVERDAWQELLDDEERRAWSAALEAYTAARGRSLTFDAGLIAVRDWAAGVVERSAIPATDRPLADAIEAVLPIYRRHWWPAHDSRNRAWIEAVSPTLAEIEEDMVPRLEAAYGGRWPDAPIPVDVVAYANAVGAYSTGGRLTIASGDEGNRMPQGLELIFHEASHVDPLEGPLRDGIARAFQSQGAEAPERFWHDMIFYTCGELTRIVLAEHGRPGYRHYGEGGVYVRGERWTVQLPALERHWRPFLESGSRVADARRAALEAVAADLLNGRDGAK